MPSATAVDRKWWTRIRGQPKSKALHSSAALAVNVFDYWATRNPTPLAAAMELHGIIRHIEFEKKYPTWLSGNPPNSDVVLLLESGTTIAIESKLTESMTAKLSGRSLKGILIGLAQQLRQQTSQDNPMERKL